MGSNPSSQNSKSQVYIGLIFEVSSKNIFIDPFHNNPQNYEL